MTHGFVVDGKGRKMSKSVGNVVSPNDILKKYGVDILRLWVVASDYYDDLKLDDSILKAQSDSYRRIRNTFRYLIGNLNNFEKEEEISVNQFPELERFILHRLWEIDIVIKDCIKNYNFHLMFTTLLNFCSSELSSFYFDIRKDVIYCDNFKSIKRRSARTLLNILFNHLIRWLAPSLVFTCEEAWQARGNKTSIHLEDFLSVDDNFKNIKLSQKWQNIKDIRKVITGALEKKRAEKTIGSSLEANVNVYLSKDRIDLLEETDLAEISITSSYKVFTLNNKLSFFKNEEIKDVFVEITEVTGDKCERCWKYTDNINANHICNRCSSAIER